MSSSSSTVDGLISGLDTSSIVTQLMQVESAPQQALQTKKTKEQAQVTAYQAVNTKMAALQTAAEALTKATAWTPTTASSTSASVTATSSTTAAPGNLTFDVTSLATSKSVVSNDTWSSATASSTKSGSSSVSYPMAIVKDGKVVGSVSPASGSLKDVVAAVNKAGNGAGISAVAIRTGDGEYRMQINSTATGAVNDFQLVPGNYTVGDAVDTSTTPQADGFTQLSAAADATLSLGNGITASSSTNTFADLMPGTTITTTAVASGVTVSVAQDPKTVASSMKAFVDAANDALKSIAAQSKAGTVDSSGSLQGAGALAGDSTLRSLRDKILSTFSSAVGGQSLSKAGIQLTSSGTVTFDQDDFLTNYAADPKMVTNLVAPTSVSSTSTSKGIAELLGGVAKAATDKVTGSLTTQINGHNSDIDDLTDRISDWDTRLASRKERYQKYYSGLEVALGKLQSQSTSVLAALNQMS